MGEIAEMKKLRHFEPEAKKISDEAFTSSAHTLICKIRK